ncbi:MAG: hypothetical protein BGO12_23560 [Verrucomicrobia bacterium 61-8]|nr:MAG: hypothetical protein BGO12_23560 [Verrucomicrobia bacterium 61-8]
MGKRLFGMVRDWPLIAKSAEVSGAKEIRPMLPIPLGGVLIAEFFARQDDFEIRIDIDPLAGG